MTEPLDLLARPCVRGCTRAGTDDNMPARHGNYCARCYGRIDQALIQAPELAQHILGNVTPGGAASDDRVDSSKEAPLPFNQNAFDDVSELYSLLVYWCNIWAGYLEVREIAPTARVWRRDSGTVIGLPANIAPDDAYREVARMSGWLRDRLDAILTLAPEDVDEFDESIVFVWRMNARWPRLEKPRYSDVPCPATGCEERIAVHPPVERGGTKAIACDGGHYYAEEEYDELAVAMVARRIEAKRQARVKGGKARQSAGRTEQQKANDVIAHLWRKYGWVDGKPEEQSA